MAHERHYSAGQANEALPWVRDHLEGLRAARRRLNDSEAHAALSEVGPSNGGGAPGQKVSEAFLAMRSGLMELRRMDVVLRDLDRGLVDFPALRGGREVYLCWEEGEDAVEHWHEADAGHDGRRPLDDG